MRTDGSKEILQVGYLGPSGTYSHLVARKKFGRNARLIPLPTIMDVCLHAARGLCNRGVIPVENSSGGAISETVDILLAGSPRVVISEELVLDVKLALLGKASGGTIRTLFSHFAPLDHCAKWIRGNLPGVEKRVVSSTAVAAQQASQVKNAAALGSRTLAKLYGLDVIKYPVEADVPNMTVFFIIGGKKPAAQGTLRGCKTTLAVQLHNKPGSLCSFLDVFRQGDVNLSRLVSRPLRGTPGEYSFLVDIEGCAWDDRIKPVLAAARKACVNMRIAGSYPSGRIYQS